MKTENQPDVTDRQNCPPAVRSSDLLDGRCNCVEKLQEEMERRFGADAEMEIVTKCNINTGETWQAFPPIYFKHREIGANGKPTKKWKRTHFRPCFCQMCGKAI